MNDAESLVDINDDGTIGVIWYNSKDDLVCPYCDYLSGRWYDAKDAYRFAASIHRSEPCRCVAHFDVGTPDEAMVGPIPGYQPVTGQDIFVGLNIDELVKERNMRAGFKTVDSNLVFDLHCPYCGFLFDKTPKGKKRCVNCHNVAYVKRPWNGDRRLCTKEQASTIEADFKVKCAESAAAAQLLSKQFREESKVAQERPMTEQDRKQFDAFTLEHYGLTYEQFLKKKVGTIIDLMPK